MKRKLFKKGDRVKRINNSIGNIIKGKIYTILKDEISEHQELLLVECPSKYYYYSSSFRLVSSVEFSYTIY